MRSNFIKYYIEIDRKNELQFKQSKYENKQINKYIKIVVKIENQK